MRYELLVFQEDIPILRSELLKIHLQEFNMIPLVKKLFCIHVYEYEQMTEIGEHMECRKCGDSKTDYSS